MASIDVVVLSAVAPEPYEPSKCPVVFRLTVRSPFYEPSKFKGYLHAEAESGSYTTANCKDNFIDPRKLYGHQDEYLFVFGNAVFPNRKDLFLVLDVYYSPTGIFKAENHKSELVKLVKMEDAPWEPNDKEKRLLQLLGWRLV